jgi:iron(II)-dependent oxidoreductase
MSVAYLSREQGPERLLREASAHMEQSVRGLDDEALRAQFDPQFSPIGWHLGHVAWQEEIWLLRTDKGVQPIAPAFDQIFDAFVPNKSQRGARLPSRAAIFEYRAEVRHRVLARLASLLDEPSGLMQGDGLLHFVANHERQHAETVLTARLLGSLFFSEDAPLLPDCEPAPSFVSFSGGPSFLGCDDDPDGWDNERPRHELQLERFELCSQLVSNGEWLEFLQAGGYQQKSLWSEEGWRFITADAIEAPLHWCLQGRTPVSERSLAGELDFSETRALCHVSHHEAEAFARFRGARLPSEAEWEHAARVEGTRGQRRGKAPTVSLMTGAVWQWTRDAFLPYPGFSPQAYRGYSEPWFDGAHQSLRGGAYVTQREITRIPFRNWYQRQMRQPFVGLRLARS